MSGKVPTGIGTMRGAIGAAALIVSSIALWSGCGGDDGSAADGSGGAERMTISVDRSGLLEAPASAKPGPTEITIDNAGERPAEVQLIRVEGGRSAADTAKALGAVLKGAPMPAWFVPAGGIGSTEPGATPAVTQVLEPGTYYVFNEDGPMPEPSTMPAIEVSGEEAGGDLPEAEATVTAFDYGFEADGLEAGTNRLLFENVGEQPHHLVAMPIVAGRTIEDVEEFFRTEQGRPPLDERREVSTAVIEGGDRQVVTVDLEPGKYALLCFIADREGGPPHIVKGMIDEAEVSG